MKCENDEVIREMQNIKYKIDSKCKLNNIILGETYILYGRYIILYIIYVELDRVA